MERLMQYVWQHRLWLQSDMHTVDGRRVQVIDPGLLNTDAGPDFFNAKISIDGRLWAGNVEIHVKASDWFRHGHDRDDAYESVILHVVDRDDAVVRRHDGEVIPQLRMPCAEDLNIHYTRLLSSACADLPCAAHLSGMPQVQLCSWITSLAYERLYEKTDRIDQLLQRFAGDWEQACYITLARCLGFGKNNDAFERLALSVPLAFVRKHADNPQAVEALLFGQAGFLEGTLPDEYSRGLKREYDFLCTKFGLRRPESLGWKMARMRPATFPMRRIALLAALLGDDGFRMLQRIVNITDIDSACRLFMPELSNYWRTRYNFGTATQTALASMSRSSALIVVINVVVPLMLAYGNARSDTSLTDRAVELLQSIPAEHNSITDMFAAAGITVRDAFTSQALIQLRRQYCEQRKCLYCRIGHRMLSTAAIRRNQ